MTDVCLFVGYPNKTKGRAFYNIHVEKVFVLTNTKFVEKDCKKPCTHACESSQIT